MSHDPQRESNEDMIFVLARRILGLLRESGASPEQVKAALACAAAVVPATELNAQQFYSR